jgi:hypothetical protein
MSDMTLGTTLFVILAGFVLSLLPTWVAIGRNCKATGGIFVINLFLGWTVLGWIIALAWAAAGDPKPQERG